MIRRVAAAVSGGVDSAVSAALLKDRGFDVHGVFMKNWDLTDETGLCSAEKDYEDAKYVCDTLKIPLTRVNFVKQYWNEVFVNLVKDYESGLTPNPDILCNRNVKFKSFYQYCRNNLKVDAIATGHYANTTFGPFLENYNPDKCVKLLRPCDSFKDQTFFLSQVEQEPLRHTMFPIANYKKSIVRDIAKGKGLNNVFKKRDSVGICFVGKRRFQDFISEYIPSKPGNCIDIDTGKIVGVHNGIHQWTMGQRCNITGKSIAYFIYKKDLSNNNLYVAPGTEHSSLMCDIFYTEKPHWIFEEPHALKMNYTFKCEFRFQHIHPLIKCMIVKSHSGLIIKLEEPIRALAPGQYAAFYSDQECFGSARILKVGPSIYFTK